MDHADIEAKLHAAGVGMNATRSDVEDVVQIHEIAKEVAEARKRAAEIHVRLLGRHSADTLQELVNANVIGDGFIDVFKSILVDPFTTRDAFGQVRVKAPREGGGDG